MSRREFLPNTDSFGFEVASDFGLHSDTLGIKFPRKLDFKLLASPFEAGFLAPEFQFSAA